MRKRRLELSVHWNDYRRRRPRWGNRQRQLRNAMIIRQLTNEELGALSDGLKLASELVDAPIDASSTQSLYDVVLQAESPTDEVIISLGFAFWKTDSRLSRV